MNSPTSHRLSPREWALIEPHRVALRAWLRWVAMLVLFVAMLAPSIGAEAQNAPSSFRESRGSRSSGSPNRRVRRAHDRSRSRSIRTAHDHHHHHESGPGYDGPFAGALTVSGLLAFVDQGALALDGRRIDDGPRSGRQLGLGPSLHGGLGVSGALVVMSGRIGLGADLLFGGDEHAITVDGSRLELGSTLRDFFELGPRVFAGWTPRLAGPLELLLGGFVGGRWSTFSVAAGERSYQRLEQWAWTTGPELGARVRLAPLTFELSARIDLLRAFGTVIALSIAIDPPPPQLLEARSRP